MTTSPSVLRLELRRPSGWSLGMHIVPLARGEVLIHSPTWIDENALQQIESLGRPRILFAPNHYHYLGLHRYRASFPEATIVAHSEAIPRLRARGQDGIVAAQDVSLPGQVRWLFPEGTKSGEAWLAIDAEDGPTWIVCDAFFHISGALRGFEGMMLRLARTAPGLCIGTTFKLLAVRDAKRYREWVLAALDRENPRRILFSHGEPLESDAAARLSALIRARL